MTNSLNKGSGQTVFSSANLQIRDEEGYLVNFIVSYTYPNNALKVLAEALKYNWHSVCSFSLPIIVERLQHKYTEVKISFTRDAYIVVESINSELYFTACADKAEFKESLDKLLSISE